MISAPLNRIPASGCADLFSTLDGSLTVLPNVTQMFDFPRVFTNYYCIAILVLRQGDNDGFGESGSPIVSGELNLPTGSHEQCDM